MSENTLITILIVFVFVLLILSYVAIGAVIDFHLKDLTDTIKEFTNE